MADESAVHLFPVQIRIYADGYTVADRAACDAHGYYEIRCDLPTNTVLNPLAVTCRACIDAPLYSSALRAAAAGVDPPYPVTIVDRMAHRVFRGGGRYDVTENNRVREWLGLAPLFPSEELLSALLVEEQRIYDGHRENRRQAEEIRKYMADQAITGNAVVIRRTELVSGTMTTELIIEVSDANDGET